VVLVLVWVSAQVPAHVAVLELEPGVASGRVLVQELALASVLASGSVPVSPQVPVSRPVRALMPVPA
jgi:hypothetical protein